MQLRLFSFLLIRWLIWRSMRDRTSVYKSNAILHSLSLSIFMNNGEFLDITKGALISFLLLCWFCENIAREQSVAAQNQHSSRFSRCSSVSLYVSMPQSISFFRWKSSELTKKNLDQRRSTCAMTLILIMFFFGRWVLLLSSTAMTLRFSCLVLSCLARYQRRSIGFVCRQSNNEQVFFTVFHRQRREKKYEDLLIKYILSFFFCFWSQGIDQKEWWR